MFILEGIIAILAAIAGALIALGIQYRRLERTETQQQAWERAQESHLRSWETQQEKRLADLETRLTTQLQQVKQAWQTWETKDAARLESLAQEYKTAMTQSNLEHELARILRNEEIPLTTNKHGESRPTVATWRPPMLHGADLRGRDLSHRYLGYADLQEAQLAGATLFMANLSGARLAGANLSGANLSGADLSGADLRNAILTDANLLVADLHNTVLTGANLLGARNFTTQQLHSAIYDNTTLLDVAVDSTPPRMQRVPKASVTDITLARIEAVSPSTPSLPPTPAPASTEAATLAAPTETSELTATPTTVGAALEISSPAVEPMAAPSVETPHLATTPTTVEISAETPVSPAESVAAPSLPEASPETLTTSTTSTPAAQVTPEAMQSEELPSPFIPDMTSFIQYLDEPSPAQASVTTPSASDELPLQAPDLSATSVTGEPVHEESPETPISSATPVSDALTTTTSPTESAASITPESAGQLELLSSTLLPDMTSFIQHLPEPAPSSPLTSGGSLLDPGVTDLLVDTQESKGTGEVDTATQRRKHSGKRVAKRD